MTYRVSNLENCLTGYRELVILICDIGELYLAERRTSVFDPET
jgi:hypothetical protein